MPTEATSPVLRSTSTLTSAKYPTSAFTSSKCPHRQSPTSGDLPRDAAHLQTLGSKPFPGFHAIRADGTVFFPSGHM
jgi:hypothetical protein